MRRLSWALALMLLLAPSAARAAEAPVKINDLVEQAAHFDQKTVTIEGEVIGDVMVRGEYGWVNVSDGSNDIGVLAPAAELRRIRFTGRYHTRGDTVRVTGTFYRADPQQGGDLDIRTGAIEVLHAGESVGHSIPPGRVPLAAGALGLAGVLGFLVRSRVRAVK